MVAALDLRAVPAAARPDGVRRAERTAPIDNPPNGHGAHLGSSYQGPWFGYVRKDLRTLLGGKVKGRYGKVYCGKGSLKRCRSGARVLAAGRGRGARRQALLGRRGLPEGGQGRRPGVLRRDPASARSAPPPSR